MHDVAPRGDGWTLPGRYYTDPAIFAAEREKIFFRSWIYAGHKSLLPEPGSFLTVDILDQGVVVLRGHDGALRAFHNVCQHRGHRLLEGCGRTPVVTCPYHAWAYGLDGALRTARGSEKVPGFDPAAFGLKPVRVEEFLGFLFVNLDRAAAPFAELYQGLAEEIRALAPWLDRLELVNEARAYEGEETLACNWKVLLDNCIECYHCTPSHPAFVDLIDIDTYKIKLHPLHTTHTGVASKPRNRAYPYAADAAVKGLVFWHVWPNLTFGMFPGSENFVAFVIDPVGPEETRSRGHRFALPGPASAHDTARQEYSSAILWPEDKGICEAVQRGLHSRGYDRGRFIVNQDRHDLSEHAAAYFQRKVITALEA